MYIWIYTCVSKYKCSIWIMLFYICFRADHVTLGNLLVYLNHFFYFLFLPSTLPTQSIIFQIHGLRSFNCKYTIICKWFQGWLPGIEITNWHPLTMGRCFFPCSQHSTVSCIWFSRDETLRIFPFSRSHVYWCGTDNMAAEYACVCWSSFRFTSIICLSFDLYHPISTSSAVMLQVIYHFCSPSNVLSSCPLSSL